MSCNNKWNAMLSDVSRRQAMKLGVCATAGMMLPSAGLRAASLTASPAQSTAPKQTPGKAKAVIQIWMWGGPTHLDTFDPKPDAGYDYCGPLKSPIATNVKGIRIGELLPMLAQQADKYSIIRSMTHGNNGHETAAYLVQTAHKGGDGVVWPSMGAVVAAYKGYDAGYKGLIPPYIVLTELQGRFSEVGFLNGKCKPFPTGGDPSAQRFMVEGVIAPGITDERQHARRSFLKAVNAMERAEPEDARLSEFTRSESEAYDLILGDAGKVFDLSQEKEDLRVKYGKNKFGQSCLMARRLVERGVPYVTINYPGWDMHKEIFPQLRRKLPEMDRAVATLITDLSERGLLDSTIVWWSGEFGRTPKVDWQAPWNGGRGHYGPCFSAMVAGGGFKGGQVVGESDANGEQVKYRPVYPWDLVGSMYELLGINPDGNLPHPGGKIVRALPTEADGIKVGGRLKEIM